MNESLFLFESKWKSFLKESTNSDVNRIVDRIMNKQTPTKDRVDKKIAAIKKQKQPIRKKNPTLSDIPGFNEDDDGHVIKCGEVRSDNITDKAFYKKYLKKPSKNFIVHYYKTFKTPDCEMYLAITNKFLTFYEYAQFIIASKSNQRVYTMDRHGYPYFLTNLTYEINAIREDLINTLSKTKKDFPTVNLTFATIYKVLSERKPKTIKYFYNELSAIYGLSPKEAYKILTEIIKVYCTQTKPDLSFNNLGVNITAGINNPAFFFFDQ